MFTLTELISEGFTIEIQEAPGESGDMVVTVINRHRARSARTGKTVEEATLNAVLGLAGDTGA